MGLYRLRADLAGIADIRGSGAVYVPGEKAVTMDRWPRLQGGIVLKPGDLRLRIVLCQVDAMKGKQLQGTSATLYAIGLSVEEAVERITRALEAEK